MRWSKIKNIIILLLVIVNGFLLGQVGLWEWRSRWSDRETRERMVDILARNGVAFLPQEVPGTLDLISHRVTLSPFGEEQAALLVGPVSGVQTSGARTVYTGTEGIAVNAASGELEVEFDSGTALSENAVLERLSKLGVDLQRVDQAGAGEKDGLRYVQLWNGIPIPGQAAVLSFFEGGTQVQTLNLRLLAGTWEDLPAEETVAAATALARLLDELSRGEGYVCSQITEMYPGYVVGGVGDVTLTPAWFIETDTWRFAVDGHTGAVTAME